MSVGPELSNSELGSPQLDWALQLVLLEDQTQARIVDTGGLGDNLRDRSDLDPEPVEGIRDVALEISAPSLAAEVDLSLVVHEERWPEECASAVHAGEVAGAVNSISPEQLVWFLWEHTD